MEISRSETGFFHVAYAVKNSPGLSTGSPFANSTRHTRNMNELFSRFQNSDFGNTSARFEGRGFVAWSELQRLAGE
jgi:hypothetical protein